MLKVKGAWFLDTLPTHAVVELEDGELFKFFITPFRQLKKMDMGAYKGYHPSKCSGHPFPAYMYRMYGLELAGPSPDTWYTASEVEKLYSLPEASVRRDIHRDKFSDDEVKKVGRDWTVRADAAERRYKK